MAGTRGGQPRLSRTHRPIARSLAHLVLGRRPGIYTVVGDSSWFKTTTLDNVEETREATSVVRDKSEMC